MGLMPIDTNRLTVIPFRTTKPTTCGSCHREKPINSKMLEIWQGKEYQRCLCETCNQRRKKGEIK